MISVLIYNLMVVFCSKLFVALICCVNGRSYVCDVNGLSFVKSSVKYYADCAKVIGHMIIRELASHIEIPASLNLESGYSNVNEKS